MSKSKPRRRVTPMPPRGMRPKLSRDQVRDLGITHVTNLDLIVRGKATEEILWHWVEGVLTWLRAAKLMQTGIPEMSEQWALAERLIARYRETNSVGFCDGDYKQAKLGTIVMDKLAEIVDKTTALAAVEWSEAQTKLLKAKLDILPVLKDGDSLYRGCMSAAETEPQ